VTKRAPAAALIAAMALAGCGGGKPKQPTLAQVCATHVRDIGTIAGGTFAFKYYMEHEDPGGASALTAIAPDTQEAIARLTDAAVGATSPNLEAMRAFLRDLQDLSSALGDPPSIPTAFAGDQTVAMLQTDAKRAGCPLSG
jgi:hypothetical protein